MAARSSAANETDPRELVITRVIDAPRKVVFAMWTERAHVLRWWGPQGFTLSYCAIDLRPGGAYRFHMRGPGGTDHWMQGVYREVVPPERIVSTFVWTDATGKPTRPETILTVTFAESGTKTMLTLHQVGFESISACDEHRTGWNSTFERLAEHTAVIQAE